MFVFFYFSFFLSQALFVNIEQKTFALKGPWERATNHMLQKHKKYSGFNGRNFKFYFNLLIKISSNYILNLISAAAEHLSVAAEHLSVAAELLSVAAEHLFSRDGTLMLVTAEHLFSRGRTFVSVTAEHFSVVAKHLSVVAEPLSQSRRKICKS